MTKSKLSGIVFCFLLSTHCNSFKTKYEEIPPKLPNTVTSIGRVDYSWKVQHVTGKSDSLGSLRGKKLFLNLWATWCGPCIIELPKLKALYDSMKNDTSIVFLFVSDEPESTVAQFMSKNNYQLPFYTSDKIKPAFLETKGYPTTLIINRNGEIVYKKQGSAKWDDPSVIEFISKL